MKKEEKFQEKLMEHLSKIESDKRVLKSYSKSIQKMRKNNLIVDRVLDYGIPDPDGLTFTGRLEVDKLAGLQEILELPNLKRVEIFPLGIIRPEFFKVQGVLLRNGQK